MPLNRIQEVCHFFCLIFRKAETETKDITTTVDTFNGGAMYYVACYPYESAEPGDLTFSAGEFITVIKKDGDWWTGTAGGRTGMFPSNYVQEVGAETTAPPIDSTKTAINSYADDVKNQEEADTEVSEINTQSKTDYVQDSYSRPMSTSSTTSVSFKFRAFTEKNQIFNVNNWHRRDIASKRVKWLK